MEKRDHTALLQALIEEDMWEFDLLAVSDMLTDLPEFDNLLYACLKRKATILRGLGVGNYEVK